MGFVGVGSNVAGGDIEGAAVVDGDTAGNVGEADGCVAGGALGKGADVSVVVAHSVTIVASVAAFELSGALRASDTAILPSPPSCSTFTAV